MSSYGRCCKTHSDVRAVNARNDAGPTLLMRFPSSESTCSLVSEANVPPSSFVSWLPLKFLQRHERGGVTASHVVVRGCACGGTGLGGVCVSCWSASSDARLTTGTEGCGESLRGHSSSETRSRGAKMVNDSPETFRRTNTRARSIASRHRPNINNRLRI